MIRARLMNIVLVFFGIGLLVWLANLKAPGADHPAPNMTFTKWEGGPTTLEKLRGKVVLLDFWATWCGPCRQSIPDLVQVYEKYKDKGAVVIGVSLDEPETQPQIPVMQKQLGMTYPVMKMEDIEDSHDESGESKYPHDSLPTLYVIDKNGIIRGTQAGYNPNLNLDKMVATLLKE